MLMPDTRVRVRAHRIPGHCRTPQYLKGCEGIVVGVVGAYKDPEKLAYHRPGLPAKQLYHVRFLQRNLWPSYSGSAGDTLEADLYEHWLEPIDKEVAA